MANVIYTEWRMISVATAETLTYEEKRKKLYYDQKKLLDTFLEHGAITRAQYEKSLGDLTEKMGMGERGKKEE